jgi:hypothetical protein
LLLIAPFTEMLEIVDVARLVVPVFVSVPEIARLVDVELVIVPFVAVNPTKFAS